MEKLRTQIEDAKSHIFFRDDGNGTYCDVIHNDYTRMIDEGINNWCLANWNRLPTDEEKAILRSDVAKSLLLMSGISDERLKEIELITEIAVEEKKLELLAGQV